MGTTYVMFDTTIVSQNGFQEKIEKSEWSGQISGFSMWHSKGEWKSMIDLDTTLPAEIEKYVLHVSHRETFQKVAKRISGTYQHESATATLEICTKQDPKRQGTVYAVEIIGKNMGDVQELMHLIRSGQAQLKESYEEDQLPGPSRQELMEELEQCKDQLRKVEAEFRCQSECVEERRQQLSSFAQVIKGYAKEIESGGFKWPYKAKIANDLRLIAARYPN